MEGGSRGALPPSSGEDKNRRVVKAATFTQVAAACRNGETGPSADQEPSESLLKEPLLVEAGGAGLERGSWYAVIGVLSCLDALLAQNMVQASILKTRRWREITREVFSFPKGGAKSLKH